MWQIPKSPSPSSIYFTSSGIYALTHISAALLWPIKLLICHPPPSFPPSLLGHSILILFSLISSEKPDLKGRRNKLKGKVAANLYQKRLRKSQEWDTQMGGVDEEMDDGTNHPHTFTTVLLCSVF
jgi:hypothetical protein